MAFKLVVMGASLGGMSALRAVLSRLPKDFSIAVAIVLHRDSGHEGVLVKVLQKSSSLPVIEAEDKLPFEPGCVFLAPAGYHLLVENDHFALSTEGPVCHARPSIDVLFESAADACANQVVGVVLTGANEDGAQGIAAIKRRGGLFVAQDPKTAEAPAMPMAAMAAAAPDIILPLKDIGPFLARLARTRNFSGGMGKGKGGSSRS